MSYKVLISSEIYRKHQLYREWMEHLNNINGTYSYEDYLYKFHPQILDYIEFITTDNMFFDFDENIYDKIICIDQDNNYFDKRYRLFSFRSEAHYTWFNLRW